ncbi:guided entry of tail-anchored proteins factor 1-like [Antedon mediterranea]|uniref:guided entry of tail-anchored proteins factor 1-like n=1 Tax=Antedon mediterranea TaxID=105859 RepID=UPI003AF4F8B0
MALSGNAVIVGSIIFMLHLFKMCIPFFVNKVLNIIFQVSRKELNLQASLLQLQSEKDEVNVKDEFPKYARLERKINKIVAELKDARNTHRFDSFKVRWILNIAGKCLYAFGFLVLVWCYRTIPIVTLNENWLFPLARVLAFPTGQSGSIGITCWVLICNVVIDKSTTPILTRLKTSSAKNKQI